MNMEPSQDRLARGRPAFGNRVAELTVGLSANALLVYGFDWVLYPAVIYHYGVWHGGFIMALASFAVCLASFRLYDWSRRDWLGIEAIKKLKEGGPSRLARLTAWIMNRSEPVVAVFLSLKWDPFITTLYLRHGAYNGLSARDWRIFLLSFAFGNAWWIAAIYLGISAFDWGLRQIGFAGL